MVMGTIKIDELSVEMVEESIVTAYACDSKPAYFFSYFFTEIKWIKKQDILGEAKGICFRTRISDLIICGLLKSWHDGGVCCRSQKMFLSNR